MRKNDPVARRYKKLLAGMRADLIAAGCDPAKVDKLEGGSMHGKKLTDPEVEERYERLLILHNAAEYRAFAAIWRERSPEWWKNMAMLGQTDGVEHRKLNNAATALKKALRAFLKVGAPVRDKAPPPPEGTTTPAGFEDEEEGAAGNDATENIAKARA